MTMATAVAEAVSAFARGRRIVILFAWRTFFLVVGRWLIALHHNNGE